MNSLISFFDPEEFLEIATKLRFVKDLPVNGTLRTLISRAYYAAFLKVKIKLESLGYSFLNDSRIHSDVRECLRKNLNKPNIALRLEDLFDFRVIADYEIKTRISEQICDKSIKLSEYIINSIGEL